EYRRRLSQDLSKFITEFDKRDIDFCYSIAYPYGSFDSDTLDVVKDMGFSIAFTCTEEINVLTGDEEELYYLGRYNRPHGVTSEKYFENIKKSVDIE
ncbi:MAG: polysaccharide deacetylase, partial [Oscillospiraceae bacterium]|nr:polysaccharide deacetylase [Oscillospiraceae bacterium]